MMSPASAADPSRPSSAPMPGRTILRAIMKNKRFPRRSTAWGFCRTGFRLDLAAFKGLLCAGEIRLAPCSFFIIGARVTPGDLAIPRGVIGPRPGSSDNAAGHRMKRSRLADRAQVNVNKYPAEHDQRSDVVQHVADRYGDTPGDFREPHQEPGDQKHRAPENDLPELQLLSAVIEAY